MVIFPPVFVQVIPFNLCVTQSKGHFIKSGRRDLLLLLEPLGLCSAMGRSSIEVPFSLVLFYIAQPLLKAPLMVRECYQMCLYQAKASSASTLTFSFFGEQEPHSCSELFLFLSLYLPFCLMCSFPAWAVLLLWCGCGTMGVPSAHCSHVLPKIHPLEY